MTAGLLRKNVKEGQDLGSLLEGYSVSDLVGDREDGGLAGQEWKSRSTMGIKMARLGKESERFSPGPRLGKSTGEKPVVREKIGGGGGVGCL